MQLSISFNSFVGLFHKRFSIKFLLFDAFNVNHWGKISKLVLFLFFLNWFLIKKF